MNTENENMAEVAIKKKSELRHENVFVFAYEKTKAQISCAVTAQLNVFGFDT